MRSAAWLFVIVLVLAACTPAAEESPGPDDPGTDASPGTAEGSPDDGGTVEGSIRVALGDIEGVETLNLLIALERVRERGSGARTGVTRVDRQGREQEHARRAPLRRR